MTQPEQHMFAQSIFNLQLPATINVFQVAPTLVLCAWITKVCTLHELQGIWRQDWTEHRAEMGRLQRAVIWQHDWYGKEVKSDIHYLIHTLINQSLSLFSTVWLLPPTAPLTLKIFIELFIIMVNCNYYCLFQASYIMVYGVFRDCCVSVLSGFYRFYKGHREEAVGVCWYSKQTIHWKWHNW